MSTKGRIQHDQGAPEWITGRREEIAKGTLPIIGVTEADSPEPNVIRFREKEMKQGKHGVPAGATAQNAPAAANENTSGPQATRRSNARRNT